MKKNIIIFGPFDRFNYGDLLFPYMIEYSFNTKFPEVYSFHKFSLAASDLRKQGGVKSGNYREMLNAIERNGTEAVIIAGGQCLSSKWDNLYSYISKPYNTFRELPFMKKLLSRLPYAKFIMGGYSEFPFVIDRNQFETQFKIIYNAVGGASSNAIINARLKKSDYVAVREKHSLEILKQNDVTSALVPDSAIIMSDVYPIDSLQNHPQIRPDIKSYLSKKDKYVFIQVSKYKHLDSLEEIRKQLEILNSENGLNILLCPIGTAGGHEDHIPLLEIYNKLQVKNKYFVENPNVLEIMSLIANASLYVGTSLHGIITSMSFGVPYVGINKSQVKLQAYVETWGLDNLGEIQHPKDFISYAQRALSVSQFAILEESKTAKEVYYDHVEKMHQILK